MSLAQKGFAGFIFTFSSSLINKVLAFVGGILLARMLMPEDFGLVAMLYIIFAISSHLVKAGFGLAVIREREINEQDKATVFYSNLIVSITLYLILWFSAPAIASFYGKEELIVLTRIMGLDLLFNSFTIIQRAVLTRDLKFKLLSIAEVISGIVVIGIPLIMAYYGYGVLALAVKFILGSLMTSIILFTVNPWMPKGFININSFKKLFSFSSNVMILGIVNSISKNLHQVIIGKYFSAASLGFFNQGNTFKETIIGTLNNTVMEVTFPILSKLQEDTHRLKQGYSRIMRINSFTIFPMITLLILIAEPLIITLLGEKWRGTIVFLQILGISGYVMHLHNINLNVLKVYGKGRDYLMQGIFRNGLTIIGIAVAINFSTIAMAWAFVATEFAQLGVNVYYSNKYLSFKFKEQLKVMLPIIAITFIMAVAVYLLSTLNYGSDWLKLIVLSFSGILIYGGMALTFKLEVIDEVKVLFLSKFKR